MGNAGCNSSGVKKGLSGRQELNEAMGNAGFPPRPSRPRAAAPAGAERSNGECGEVPVMPKRFRVPPAGAERSNGECGVTSFPQTRKNRRPGRS